MFSPQRYMTLTVGKDKIHLNKMVFSIVEDSCETFTHNYNIIGLVQFLEKYKNDIGILIDNDKKCIELFQSMIDDGEPVPGYVLMFESHIFFILTPRSLPEGIKRVGEPVEEKYKNDDNVIKLPDIRKLLERV